ncbi:MAG TPA: hypothetical protein VJ738_05380 [Steroidobacteraceae bacterium]|nr:hypothetical protein [Steroidobacteraceae bacterium]
MTDESNVADAATRRLLVEKRLARFVPRRRLTDRIRPRPLPGFFSGAACATLLCAELELSELEEHTAQFDPRCRIGNPKTGIRRDQLEFLATVYVYLRDEIMPALEYSLAQTEIIDRQTTLTIADVEKFLAEHPGSVPWSQFGPCPGALTESQWAPYREALDVHILREHDKGRTPREIAEQLAFIQRSDVLQIVNRTLFGVSDPENF